MIAPLWFLFVAILGLPSRGTEGVAERADSDRAKTSAGELLERGNSAFATEKHEEALRLYEEAYALFPSPMLFLSLAEAHRALGHLIRAATHYERFLSEAGLEPGAELFDAALEKLRGIEAHVASLTLRPHPEGLAITLDGTPMEPPLSRKPIRVEPGRHRIEGRRLGYVTVEQEIEIGPGESRDVELHLVAEPARVSLDPPLLPRGHFSVEEELSDGAETEWWFWLGLGVVAAAVVGTAVALGAPGDRFVPGGEFGASSLSEWRRF